LDGEIRLLDAGGTKRGNLMFYQDEGGCCAMDEFRKGSEDSVRYLFASIRLRRWVLIAPVLSAE
jgi:hypothetical protein